MHCKVYMLAFHNYSLYYIYILQVPRGNSRNDGLLADYCDGFIFQKHALYSLQRNALQIFLYFDEVEVCNPLGTKVKCHKLGELMRLESTLHASNLALQVLFLNS